MIGILDRVLDRVINAFSGLLPCRTGEAALQALEAPESPESGDAADVVEESEQMKILKKGPAMRIIFFYPGEEGTYVENADVTLYDNGIVHIQSSQEETTTHLQNCEILWRFEVDGEDRANKVRLLKPKGEARSHDDGSDGVNSLGNLGTREVPPAPDRPRG